MPRTPVPHGSIVVGLDSSPTGVAALEWAVPEASRRNLPLHLLHAYFHGSRIEAMSFCEPRSCRLQLSS